MTERKTVWWDRAVGGFYLSYESIPEVLRKAEGRIVKMVEAQESTPSIDTPEFESLLVDYAENYEADYRWQSADTNAELVSSKAVLVAFIDNK